MATAEAQSKARERMNAMWRAHARNREQRLHELEARVEQQARWMARLATLLAIDDATERERQTTGTRSV